MGHNAGKITAPVNTDDVRAVLGVDSHDVKTLCMSDKINGWSLHKPLRGFSFRALAERDFTGEAEDVAAGVVYGLRAATAAGRLDGIHDCDFGYAGRPGDTDWGRLTDFEGYDHNAAPLPTGTVPEWHYIDLGSATVRVTLSFAGGFNGTGKPSNQRAVSVDGIIRATDSANASARLSAYYPCACVTLRGSEWLRCLDTGANAELERPDPSLPVVGGGKSGQTVTSDGTDSGSWLVNWDMPLGTLMEKAGVAAPNDGETLTVSVCFLPQVKFAGTGLDLTEWTQLRKGILYYTRAFGCPQATGRTLEMRRYYQPGLACRAPLYNGKKVTVDVVKASKWSAATYRLEVVLTAPRTGIDIPDSRTVSYTHTFEEAGELGPQVSGGLVLPLTTLTLLESLSGIAEGTWAMEWSVTVVGSSGIVTNRGAEMLVVGDISPIRPST